MKPQIESMISLYLKLTDIAVQLMKEHAPKSVDGLIDKIITKTIFFRTVGLIGKCAADSGELVLPDDDKPIAVFVYEITEQDKRSVSEGCQV